MRGAPACQFELHRGGASANKNEYQQKQIADHQSLALNVVCV